MLWCGSEFTLFIIAAFALHQPVQVEELGVDLNWHASLKYD
jgi:hypothetical protein